MKPTIFLLTTLSALVAAVPVHTSSPLPPRPSAPASGSGQMVDNMLPNNNLPSGGIGSSTPTAKLRHKRAIANAVPDTFDSSTYYDAAAEKEAEELALVLDAARENVAEDEGADKNVNVKRRRQNEGRRDVGGCKKYTPAKCKECQKEWEMYQACLCEKKGSGLDVCVQGKRQNYVSGRPSKRMRMEKRRR